MEFVPNYPGFVASAPFKLLVGPEQKPYFVHAALLASASKPFDRLVNGQMQEALSGCASFEDIDDATIIRFIEFLYTGDYDENAESLIVEREDSLPLSSDSKAGENSGTEHAAEADSKEPPSSKASMNTDKVETAPDRADLFNELKSVDFYPNRFFAPRQSRNPKEDYTELYLSHARVWTFADMYDVRRLRAISAQKLKLNLMSTDPAYQSAGLVALLRYAYTHTPYRPNSNAYDLRVLTSHFASCFISALWVDTKFPDLLAEQAELSKDIIEWTSLKAEAT